MKKYKKEARGMKYKNEFINCNPNCSSGLGSLGKYEQFGQNNNKSHKTQQGESGINNVNGFFDFFSIFNSRKSVITTTALSVQIIRGFV